MGLRNVDNMQHPTNLLRALSACCIFFVSGCGQGLRDCLYQGVICKHRCHACHPGELLSWQASSSSHFNVMSTLIVSFLYFNLLFPLEDNLISL